MSKPAGKERESTRAECGAAREHNNGLFLPYYAFGSCGNGA